MDNEKKITESKTKQAKYLVNRFENCKTENFILAGNQAADKLTNERPQEAPDTVFFKNSNYYQVKTKDTIFETKLRKRIAETLLEDAERSRYKLSRKAYDNWDKIELDLSNAHLKDSKYDHLFDWTHRVRTMSLCTGVRGFTLGSLKKSINLEILFPTPTCETCNHINDYWHLWQCKELKEIWKECTTKAKEILEKYGEYGKEWTPYWITEKDELKTSVVPYGRFNPCRRCICNLPEHGTYLHCTKCKKAFHPVCIGIILPVGKIDIGNFKCKDCDPNNLKYYYSKHVEEKETEKREITRDALLCEVLGYTSRQNRAKRNHAEELWNETELQRYQEECETTNLAKRGNMGYIPKQAYQAMKIAGKDNGIDKKTIRDDAIRINTLVLEYSQKLYKEHWKLNLRWREKEGVNIKSLDWKHTKQKSEESDTWDKG